MVLLILDTSTERGVVGLSQDEKILVMKELPFGLKSSASLYENITACFESAQIKPSNLQGIAVGRGPGAFTGIRIAVAFAKGLSISNELPLFGFSSLEGFISPNAGPFASIIEANTQGVYLLLRERKGDQIVTLKEEAYVLYKDLQDAIKNCNTLITPSKARLQKKMNHSQILESAPCLSFINKIVNKETREKFNLEYLSFV